MSQPIPPVVVELKDFGDGQGPLLGFTQHWPLEDDTVEMNLVVVPVGEWPAVRDAINKAVNQIDRGLS